MEINKYSNIPLYSQLSNIIVKDIEDGVFAEGTKIPSEQEFCTKYDISRPTVRQAINELTISGYLYKEKGKGTFVSKDRENNDMKIFDVFGESIIERETHDNIEFISIKEIDKSNRKILDALNIYDKVAEIRYTVKNNDETVSLYVSYVPLNIFPDIVNQMKENKCSADILKGKYPYVPAKSRSICGTVYAGQSEQQILKVKSGQSLLKVENEFYSKAGQIVEVLVIKHRLDKCKLYIEKLR